MKAPGFTTNGRAQYGIFMGINQVKFITIVTGDFTKIFPIFYMF